MPAIAFRLPQLTSQLNVDGGRVNAHLEELARFGKTAEGEQIVLPTLTLICKRVST